MLCRDRLLLLRTGACRQWVLANNRCRCRRRELGNRALVLHCVGRSRVQLLVSVLVLHVDVLVVRRVSRHLSRRNKVVACRLVERLNRLLLSILGGLFCLLWCLARRRCLLSQLVRRRRRCRQPLVAWCHRNLLRLVLRGGGSCSQLLCAV